VTDLSRLDFRWTGGLNPATLQCFALREIADNLATLGKQMQSSVDKNPRPDDRSGAADELRFGAFRYLPDQSILLKAAADRARR
jgi:hypothetical protein